MTKKMGTKQKRWELTNSVQSKKNLDSLPGSFWIAQKQT